MSKIKGIGNGKYTFMSPIGEEVIISDIDGLFPFKNHYAIYRVRQKENHYRRKFGYIDEYGNKLTKMLFDHADDFENGLARVKLNGMQNYINKNGREILSWSYEFCDKFIGNTFIIKMKTDSIEDDLWGLINLQEDFIIYPVFKNKIDVISEAKKHLNKIINA